MMRALARTSNPTALLVALVALGATAVALTGAVSARAAGVLNYPCTDPHLPGTFRVAAGGEKWAFQDLCPTGLRLTAADPDAGPFTAVYPPATPGAGLSIAKLELDLSGHDGTAYGRRQGVRVCRVSFADRVEECGPIITTNTSFASLPEHKALSVEGGQIPVGGNQLQIVGECVGGSAPCAPGGSLWLGGIVVEFADDRPPTAKVGAISGPWVENQWVNQSFRYRLVATDAQSGLMNMRYRQGAPHVEYSLEAECSLDGVGTIGWCESWKTHEDGFDPQLWSIPGGFTQGANEISLMAIDASGNVSPEAKLEFRLDSVSPSSPANLRVAGASASGWIADPSKVKLEWDNGVETVETSTRSGVGWADLDLGSGGERVGMGFGSAAAPAELREISIPNMGARTRTIAQVRTRDRAGNASGWSSVEIKIDKSVLDAPEIESIPLLGTSGLSDAIRWSVPANVVAVPSGVCGYALKVDRSDSSDPGNVANQGPGASSSSLPSNLADGLHFAHVRAISCSGVPGFGSARSFEVDLTPPAVATDSVPGWNRSTLTITASDSGSGVAKVGYAIDGEAQVEATDDKAVLSLTEGAHALSYWAEDEAGNRSPAKAALVEVDATPPVAWIAPAEAGMPTIVRAEASDRGSGVEELRIEFSRAPGAPWEPLGSPAGIAQAEARVSVAARFPDTALPDGVYALRAVVRDAAGHSSVGMTRLDGTPATLQVPLRATPSIVAGFASPARAKRCARGRACARPPAAVRGLVRRKLVKFGQRPALKGVATDDAGEPLARIPLTFVSSGLARDSAPNVIGSTITAPDGTFVFRPPSGPSRALRVRFDGDETRSPVEAVVRIYVRGSVRLKTGRRSIRSGRSVTLSGRVLTGRDADLPSLGKEVVLEFGSGSSWAPLDIVRTAGDGSFKTRVPLFAGRRPLTYRIRARIPIETGWEFASGASSVVKVTVRP